MNKNPTEARRIMRLHSTQPGGNIMTPTVIEFGMVDGMKVAYEISEGSGFEPGSRIWGVSFWGDPDRHPENFESKCCFSLAEALGYLASTIEEARELAGS